MTDYTYVGNKAHSLSVSPSLPAYTGVRIHYEDADGQEQTYWYGDDSGSVLDFEMPWPTGQDGQLQLEAIGQYVYNQIRNKVYTPFDASAAKLDLAAEIGDAVLIGSDTYSVLANIVTEYDASGLSDVKAGGNSDLEHEFPYKSAVERSIQNLSHITSQLRVDSDSILARVESSEGDIASLELDVGGILAQVTDAQGNYTVLTMTADGIIVKGNSTGAVEISGGQLKAGTVEADSIKSYTIIESPTIYGAEYLSERGTTKLELAEVTPSGETDDFPALIWSTGGTNAHQNILIYDLAGSVLRFDAYQQNIAAYYSGTYFSEGTLSMFAALELDSGIVVGYESRGTNEPTDAGLSLGQLYFQLTGEPVNGWYPGTVWIYGG